MIGTTARAERSEGAPGRPEDARRGRALGDDERRAPQGTRWRPGSEAPGAERSRPAGGAAVRCAYCHGDFSPRDGPYSCDGCGGLLHQGCWYEAGRCPSLGCRGPRAARRRAPPLRPPRAEPREAWAVGASLHLVTLGAWLVIGLVALLGAGVWQLVVLVLLGWGLLLAGARRDWRLDASWLLVVSGLGAGVALLPIASVTLKALL